MKCPQEPYENTIWKIKTLKIWERRWWQVSVVSRASGSRAEHANSKHQQGAVPRRSSWKNTRRELQRAGGKDPCILHLFSDPGTLEPLQDVWVFSAHTEQFNNFSWEPSFPPYSTSGKPTNFYVFFHSTALRETFHMNNSLYCFLIYLSESLKQLFRHYCSIFKKYLRFQSAFLTFPV